MVSLAFALGSPFGHFVHFRMKCSLRIWSLGTVPLSLIISHTSCWKKLSSSFFFASMSEAISERHSLLVELILPCFDARHAVAGSKSWFSWDVVAMMHQLVVLNYPFVLADVQGQESIFSFQPGGNVKSSTLLRSVSQVLRVSAISGFGGAGLAWCRTSCSAVSSCLWSISVLSRCG